LRGSELEKEVDKMVRLKVGWEGPHIKPDLTWKEIASEAIVGEKKQASK
jgi:hypothetical protein